MASQHVTGVRQICVNVCVGHNMAVCPFGHTCHVIHTPHITCVGSMTPPHCANLVFLSTPIHIVRLYGPILNREQKKLGSIFIFLQTLVRILKPQEYIHHISLLSVKYGISSLCFVCILVTVYLQL